MVLGAFATFALLSVSTAWVVTHYIREFTPLNIDIDIPVPDAVLESPKVWHESLCDSTACTPGHMMEIVGDEEFEATFWAERSPEEVTRIEDSITKFLKLNPHFKRRPLGLTKINCCTSSKWEERQYVVAVSSDSYLLIELHKKPKRAVALLVSRSSHCRAPPYIPCQGVSFITAANYATWPDHWHTYILEPGNGFRSRCKGFQNAIWPRTIRSHRASVHYKYEFPTRNLLAICLRYQYEPHQLAFVSGKVASLPRIVHKCAPCNRDHISDHRCKVTCLRLHVPPGEHLHQVDCCEASNITKLEQYKAEAALTEGLRELSSSLRTDLSRLRDEEFPQRVSTVGSDPTNCSFRHLLESEHVHTDICCDKVPLLYNPDDHCIHAQSGCIYPLERGSDVAPPETPSKGVIIEPPGSSSQVRSAGITRRPLNSQSEGKTNDPGLLAKDNYVPPRRPSVVVQVPPRSQSPSASHFSQTSDSTTRGLLSVGFRDNRPPSRVSGFTFSSEPSSELNNSDESDDDEEEGSEEEEFQDSEAMMSGAESDATTRPGPINPTMVPVYTAELTTLLHLRTKGANINPNLLEEGSSVASRSVPPTPSLGPSKPLISMSGLLAEPKQRYAVPPQEGYASVTLSSDTLVNLLKKCYPGLAQYHVSKTASLGQDITYFSPTKKKVVKLGDEADDRILNEMVRATTLRQPSQPWRLTITPPREGSRNITLLHALDSHGHEYWF
jgi:hypothetical protein